MNKFLSVLLVLYVFSIICVVIDHSEAKTETVLYRPKRYLGFRNITHFFLRLNFKANMVPWNQIFAQAIGFRINWDDPPDTFHPFHHIKRRSVYKNLEILFDRNGLNGFHCVRRAICEIKDLYSPKSIYFKMLMIVFRRQSSDTDRWHNHSAEDCVVSSNNCPFSILDVSPYTDL